MTIIQLKESLQLIRALEKRSLNIKITTADGIKLFGQINKDNRFYRIEFSIESHPELFFANELRDIEINTPNPIQTPQVFFNTRNPNRVIGSIRHYYSIGFSKEKRVYNRLFIPLSENVDFHRSVHTTSVKYAGDKNWLTNQATIISLKRKKFFLYKIKSKNNAKEHGFLVVETKSKLRHKLFIEYCYSILLSFGFVTGNFIQNEGYILSYDSSEMRTCTQYTYSRFRDSLKLIYAPIYTNSFGWIDSKAIAKKYYNKIRVIYQSEFSNLCLNVFENDQIKMTILHVLETAKISLVSSPSHLAIALETMAQVFKQQHEKAYAPIKDKILAKSIRKDLLGILENNKTKIEKANGAQQDLKIIMKTLKTRIENFNSIGNLDALLKPFEILGIRLNDEDKKAIKERNSFLHGSPLFIDKELNKTKPKKEKARYYLYLKLLTLTSALILKMSGFNGLIVNYAKIYEKDTGVKLKENHYRQI